MKWVDTDKNAYLRRDNDYVSFPAKNKSRQVGCGNFETTEGLRTDSHAGDVDSHNIVCGWCAQAHVSIHSCDSTNECVQGQEIDRILLYRSPAEGITEEGIAGGEMLVSRVPVYGTIDARRGVWLRLENTCKQLKISLNQNLPDLFTLRDDESRIIAVMSSNVDDLCMAIFLRELKPCTPCCNNSWLEKRNTVTSGFAEKISDKTRLWHSCHSQRQHRTSTTNH